jgi:hypothetical protein
MPAAAARGQAMEIGVTLFATDLAMRPAEVSA